MDSASTMEAVELPVAREPVVEHPAIDNDASQTQESKRALKRKQKDIKWEVIKKLKKDAKKERKKAAKEKLLAERGPKPAVLEHSAPRPSNKELKARWQSLVPLGQKVVVDCGFDAFQSDKEIKSLSQQLMYAYGANRKMDDNPFHLFCTNFEGRIKNCLSKVPGSLDWSVTYSERSYMELFDKDELVYLTADSENVIQELDPKKVYIIGGIVDRNRLKMATYSKAMEQGIQTAKLPIDTFVQVHATRVLTVNHVFEILLQHSLIHNWERAFLNVIPTRKGVNSLEHDDEEEEQDDQEERGEDGTRNPVANHNT